MALDLGEVQAIQAEFDAEHWDHAQGDRTIGHTVLHLGKLIGKISTYSEAADHGHPVSREILDAEVIPDLLIFAARLANDGSLDLEQLFTARTAALRERFSQPHKH